MFAFGHNEEIFLFSRRFFMLSALEFRNLYFIYINNLIRILRLKLGKKSEQLRLNLHKILRTTKVLKSIG